MYKILNGVIFLLCAGVLVQTLYFCASRSKSPVPSKASDSSEPPERGRRRGLDSHLWYDMIEDDPSLKIQFQAAEVEATAELGRYRSGGTRGYGNAFDRAKQRILKEKYGIKWRTTQEMNPRVRFD